MLATTLPSSFPPALIVEIGRCVADTFREAQTAQLPLDELVDHYPGLSLTARDRPGPTAVPTTLLGARMALASRQGTRITEVTRGSPADRAGLAAGDLITRLGGIASPAPEQVEQAWTSASPGAAVVVVVSRGGVPLVLAVRKP